MSPRSSALMFSTTGRPCPSARSLTKSRFWTTPTWRRSRIVQKSRSTRTIIKGLADVLTVAARCADGVIEALESRYFSDYWIVGVQWHPEGMRDTESGHRNLFEAHVCAAERYALRRTAA